jgi:hypothetical protein
LYRYNEEDEGEEVDEEEKARRRKRTEAAARGAVVPWRFGGNSTRGARFVWTAAADHQLTLVGWQYTS